MQAQYDCPHPFTAAEKLNSDAAMQLAIGHETGGLIILCPGQAMMGGLYSLGAIYLEGSSIS